MKKLLLVVALCSLALSSRAEVSAEKLALAREAIAAMQADKIFDGMTEQMKQMASQMAQLPQDMTPAQRATMQNFQEKVMDVSMDMVKGMMAKMDGVYAKVYSEAELKAMIAFFNSPEGRSMLQKQSAIMAEIMPIIQSMQAELMPRLDQLTKELQAELAADAEAAPAPTK
jgi:hypothetical protein